VLDRRSSYNRFANFLSYWYFLFLLLVRIGIFGLVDKPDVLGIVATAARDIVRGGTALGIEGLLGEVGGDNKTGFCDILWV
jgi:hypothetical protein